MTDKPITTPEQMLEAAEQALVNSHSHQNAANLLRNLRSRIAPPDPRYEGLRERIENVLRCDTIRREGLQQFEMLGRSVLRDCLAALSEPAAPQPTADDVVRAVLEETKNYFPGWVTTVAAERAIRAAFAAGRKP